MSARFSSKHGIILMALLLTLPVVISCGRKDKPSEKKSVRQPINPYSTASLFDEVKARLAKNPEDVDALFHLADLYDRNYQYKEAIGTYKKVLALRPEKGDAYLRLGAAYSRLDQPVEAVEALKRAVKYMPNYPVAYNNLGIAYGKLGKTDEEISAFRKAVKLRPNYSTARYNLGVTYLKKGNSRAAMQEYEALKKFDEGAAGALLEEINRAS